MRGAAGQEGARAFAAKPCVAEHRRGEQRREAEAREDERVAGQVGRTEHLPHQLAGMVEEGRDEAAVGGGVRSEAACGGVE